MFRSQSNTEVGPGYVSGTLELYGDQKDFFSGLFDYWVTRRLGGFLSLMQGGMGGQFVRTVAI